MNAKKASIRCRKVDTVVEVRFRKPGSDMNLMGLQKVRYIFEVEGMLADLAVH